MNDWIASAKEVPGSWWTDWSDWLKGHADGMNVITAARVTDDATKARTAEYCKISGFTFPTFVDKDMQIGAVYQVISTPTVGSSILGGITRACVMQLAKELGMPVVEQRIPRELLYTCDEAFFTGTVAEVLPIRSVDGLQIGNGARGPLTHKLQQRFFEIARGRADDVHGWLTPV